MLFVITIVRGWELIIATATATIDYCLQGRGCHLWARSGDIRRAWSGRGGADTAVVLEQHRRQFLLLANNKLFTRAARFRTVIVVI